MIDATTIYHMCHGAEWLNAQSSGTYAGSSQDRADGFIHFSTADQVVDSAARHRAGQSGLCLLAVKVATLGASLKWEAARGGQLFPHLYGALPVAAVWWCRDLPLGRDGLHVFPSLES